MKSALARALGLLPSAGIGWTIAPQVLIGLGLGLSLDALAVAAVRGRSPLTTHGAWTIAAATRASWPPL